jgi:putative DNA primase/helicase
MKTKQPKSKFYSAASRLLSLGGNESDVFEKAQDYEIDEAGVKEWLRNRLKSKAVSSALFAGKDEKEFIYNALDQKFVEQYPDIVIFRRGENTSFYEYKNGVYTPIMDTDMYNYVDAIMAQYSLLEHRSSSRKIKDTIARISALLARTNGKHFTDEKVNKQKWFLNLKNGLLDMDTFTLMPHRKDYFSIVQVGHEYDPKATCPLFDKFINTVSGGDVSTALMIKQMYGYSISNGNPLHKVFYLYGDTARNGKSTTAKILCGLIGWGNVATLTLQQMASENSSILTSIIGKQINFSDEISSKFIESSRLTAMSAEGVVEINPKFKQSFLYPVKAKFIIACNDLPRFNDYQGMKHRMISIPFRYHLKEGERIARYDEVLLEAEGAGILNWAIEGAKSFKETHTFTLNDDSKEDLYDNMLQSAPVYAFMEMIYDFDSKFTEEISPKELYGDVAGKENKASGYRLFCEMRGTRPCSSFTFDRELKRFARETEKIKQVRVGNRGDRMYIGLKSKADVDWDNVSENF